MLRLFVGIPLPPEQRLALSLICSGLHGAKWVDPGNYHVTIRFIGEVNEGVAADIDEALGALKLPGFALSIAGLGVFGSDEKPRALFAALDKSVPLARLHERVEGQLVRAGLPHDDRRFTPHVTLARFQRGRPAEIRQFVSANNLLRLPAFQVDGFHLIVSYLTKSGAVYEDAAIYRLR